MKQSLVPIQSKLRFENQKGFLTLDFIFALMLALGFSFVFFAVSITLSLVEVGQYVTFATSRAYAGAHENQALQRELALKKFDELMALPAIRTFLGQNFMKLGPAQVGQFSDQYPTTSQDDNDIFVGARIPIDARLLHLRVPFLGSTAEDAGVGKATLNSYLMREVSTQECREQFNRARYQNIKNLPSNGGAQYSGAPGQGQEKLITDNGC